MAKLELVLPKTLEREGVRFDTDGSPRPQFSGHTNDPDDPGKETIWGITQLTATEFGYGGPMEGMPYQTAMKIYRTKFWNVMWGDQLSSLAVAQEMFDAGVNCGIHSAIGFLQEALNLLNNNGKRYPDIPTDGGMGPRTMEALRVALISATDFERAIVKAQNGEQYGYYKAKCKANPKLEKYFRGWLLNRCD